MDENIWGRRALLAWSDWFLWFACSVILADFPWFPLDSDVYSTNQLFDVSITAAGNALNAPFLFNQKPLIKTKKLNTSSFQLEAFNWNEKMNTYIDFIFLSRSLIPFPGHVFIHICLLTFFHSLLNRSYIRFFTSRYSLVNSFAIFVFEYVR